MKFDKSAVILSVCVWAPYLLVSWLYAKLSDGDFWDALLFLLAARLFFGVIETIGGFIAWHLHGKQKMIGFNLNLLIGNQFPKRTYEHDDASSYLYRISEDDSYSQQTRMAAKQWEHMLTFYEISGVILGMRMHSAADAALDIYSPKNEAKQLNI